MKETIQDAVEAYISSRTDLRESTIAEYRAIAKSQIYDRFGDMPESAIEPVQLYMGMLMDPACKKGADLLRQVLKWRHGVIVDLDGEDGGTMTMQEFGGMYMGSLDKERAEANRRAGLPEIVGKVRKVSAERGWVFRDRPGAIGSVQVPVPDDVRSLDENVINSVRSDAAYLAETIESYLDQQGYAADAVKRISDATVEAVLYEFGLDD